MDMNLFEIFDPAVCSFDELKINLSLPDFGLLIDLSKRVQSVIVTFFYDLCEGSERDKFRDPFYDSITERLVIKFSIEYDILVKMC
jgi:hypothetical protein